jgi:ribosomal protein S9
MDATTGDVTVTPSSTLAGGGGNFDSYSGSAGDNTVVDTYGTQFKYSVTGLTNTIDVNTGRKAFIVGTNTFSTFDFVVNATTNQGTPSLAATSGTIAVTLTGLDFSWLDSNTATNATGIQFDNITFANGGTTVAAGVTAISFLLADTGDTITLGAGTGGIIPEQSLALAGTQQFSSASKSASSSFVGSGALKLNGSSVTVYAVPTSAAVSNFIWLTNTGTVSGDVELTVVDGGTATDLGVIGVAAAQSEFDITKAMNAALEAKGVTLSGGRVHLEITTKVPASAASISAAYRVGDDRVNLLTSLETSN